jgi:hypothetical protein
MNPMLALAGQVIHHPICVVSVVQVVVNKRRRNSLNDLKRVVSQEVYEYRWAFQLF